MSNITQSIRAKRFRVKAGSQIDVAVSTKTGGVLKLTLENCSLGGIGTIFEGKLAKDEGLEIGEIQPAAKLTWQKHELVLGRLVLRSIRPAGENTFLGFSLVDAKFPVDGAISHELEVSNDKQLNPLEYELSPDKFNLASFNRADQTNVDIFGKCRQFAVLHAEWSKTPKFQYRTLREPSKGTRVKLGRTRKGGRTDYLVMGSNDYWGLSAHPKVMEAAKDAIDKFGFGSTGSPVTTGNTIVHQELCELLAKMFQKEKAILFNSGYAANVGALTAMVSEQDLIVADILCHMSIQNGMQMAKAASRFFKHNNIEHLGKVIAEHRADYSGTLIVTEGVFSMDGDFPPLDKINEIAKMNNARTYVDEAHSFGVLGKTGLGVCEKFDLINETDMIMGTFSKLCGGIGGFLVADEEVIDWLYFYSQAHLFSVSLPPSTAAAALAALKIFKEDTSGLQTLKENIRHFVSGLQELGYPIASTHESAVIPVVIGNEEKLGKIHQHLMDAGIYSIPMVYPAVSKTSCRFRFTIMKDHTVSDLDYVLNVLEVAMNKADFKFDQLQEGSPTEQKKVA